MYVDESGDAGLVNSPTRYFALTGTVLHELRWNECLDRIIEFRRRMRNDRLTIIRAFINELADISDLSIINIVVDKKDKPEGYDAMTKAWEALIQRFSNTMSHRNFNGPGNPDERGLIVPDNTDARKIRELLRKMRRYNPVSNQYGGGYRNLQIGNLVEDPYFKDSRDSYLIQAADVVAFALYQKLEPSSYIKRKSAHNYFNKLDAQLCKVASPRDPDGIVRL